MTVLQAYAMLLPKLVSYPGTQNPPPHIKGHCTAGVGGTKTAKSDSLLKPNEARRFRRLAFFFYKRKNPSERKNCRPTNLRVTIAKRAIKAARFLWIKGVVSLSDMLINLLFETVYQNKHPMSTNLYAIDSTIRHSICFDGQKRSNVLNAWQLYYPYIGYWYLYSRTRSAHVED